MFASLSRDIVASSELLFFICGVLLLSLHGYLKILRRRIIKEKEKVPAVSHWPIF